MSFPRCGALFFVLLAGCGGRDPLYGPVEEGTAPPPAAGGTGGSAGSGGGTAGVSGGAGSGGAGGSVRLDAGAVPPPPVLRDAAVAPPPDAALLKPDAPPAMQNCQFPDCVMKLQSACTPAGTCTQQRSGQGANNICYANGVTFFATSSGRNQTPALKVTRPDGKLCYIVEPIPRGAGVSAFVYRDASGAEVATATVDRNGTLAIVCVGQMIPQVVNLTCQPGVGGSTCAAGRCPP
jgi:hypothetical protein